MTPLRQRMIEDMQLRGLAPLTQRAYLRAVRELARYYHKSPDLIRLASLCFRADGWSNARLLGLRAADD